MGSFISPNDFDSDRQPLLFPRQHQSSSSPSSQRHHDHYDDDDDRLAAHLPPGLPTDESDSLGTSSLQLLQHGFTGSNLVDGIGNPLIVIMGLRRSGKTSIRKVVFQKMNPNETLFIESTSQIATESIADSFLKFGAVEFPGHIDPFDSASSSLNPNSVFSRCGALLFVIDAQSDYDESLKKMVPAIIQSYLINNGIKFEVFVHKVDGLSEETKMETHRRIFQTAQDDLADQGMDHIRINYHMTSIYDHSIFEAFSKVIQKLVRQLTALESLLDIFNQGSNVEKSFLFDVSSKIYIATDSTPVDMATYELCCDMIDVTLDIASIYQENQKCLETGSGIGAMGECNGPTGSHEQSSSVITLKTHQIIFLRQINAHLALVSVIKEDNFEKQGLIDFNFAVLKSGIEEVLALDNHQPQQQQN